MLCLGSETCGSPGLTNCNSSLCRCCAAWLSLDPQAQFQSSLTTFQTLDAIIPWIQHVPKIHKQWKRRNWSDEDSTRDNINNYNFRISQIWIKLGMLGNPSPCAPLLRPLCMALLRKSTNPIFWELPQSQEPQAPDLWQYMSGTKPLHRICPKNVSGVVQDPSDQCKILWGDRVGSPTQHFTRSLGSRSLSYCMCYAKTVRGSRGHVCAAPAV